MNLDDFTEALTADEQATATSLLRKLGHAVSDEYDAG